MHQKLLHKLTVRWHRDCGFAPDQHAFVEAEHRAARDAAAAYQCEVSARMHTPEPCSIWLRLL